MIGVAGDDLNVADLLAGREWPELRVGKHESELPDGGPENMFAWREIIKG